MSYVDKNLMAEEQVVYRAKLHWSIFIKFIVIFLLGLIFSVGDSLTGGLLIFVAVILVLTQFINYRTSEFAITNKRVIVKVGFIRRTSLETLLDKVEGIQVNQGILGRILNYV